MKVMLLQVVFQWVNMLTCPSKGCEIKSQHCLVGVLKKKSLKKKN